MNWFKRSLFKRSLMVGAVAAAMLTACGPIADPEKAVRSSGSLALSRDDSYLYAADTDNGIVAVINVKTKQIESKISVGNQPVRVLVGADDTIYVAVRGDGKVAVIRKDEWSVAATIDVGTEPSGLALTPDNKLLLVTSSTAKDDVEYGTLTAIDTSSLQPKWEANVGPEPRAVAVIGDGSRAVVSLMKSGELVEVNLAKGEVIEQEKDVVYKRANLTTTTGTSSGGFGGTPASYRPRAMIDLVVTPDRARVFAPVVWAREDAIARAPSAAGGYYSQGGPCSIGAVASAGIVTVDVTNSGSDVKVDDLGACASSGTIAAAAQDFPQSTLSPRFVSQASEAVQGPTVGVVDPTGNFLFVVNRESRNVVVMPAQRRDTEDVLGTGTAVIGVPTSIGAGADGIALTKDGTTAYVYSQFDHAVEKLTKGEKNSNSPLINAFSEKIVVAQDTLPADLAIGRQLFFDATDTRMSAANTNVACSTCHLEGREDGHVWSFPDGPRQTPALAGRKLLETKPYHWSGEFATIDDFNAHTIKSRMGGSGLTEATADKLDRWINQLPAAPSPLAKRVEEVDRGRKAFEKAGCDTCHSGVLLTNNKNEAVGTAVTNVGVTRSPDTVTAFNVPSLLGLGRSAPYLHDGRQATVRERVFNNTMTPDHGSTAMLSDAEKNDLVTYLKSL